MNKSLIGALISIGMVAASASLSLAQTSPGASAAAAAPVHQGMRHHQGPRAFSMPSERIEARLAYIRTALKITDAQLPQWNAYADSLRKQATQRDQRFKEWRAQGGPRAEHERPNAIAQLERQQQRHAAAAASLSERLAVQKPLYAALSAEQKLVADEVLAPRGGRHGRPHHRGMHRST